jgi:threonine aldolase
LWNACVETNISLLDYCNYFDSVSLCFSKGLGAPIGSVLLGNKKFINLAKQYRKSFGGGWRQAGMLAAAAIYAVDNNWKRYL